jgi:hypothetical protein
MSAQRTFAIWGVSLIAALALCVGLIVHHHIGAKTFAAAAYLILALVVGLDQSTIPKRNIPFCRNLSPGEYKAFREHHLSLLFPWASDFYFNCLTACGMYSIPFAISSYLDGGYVTGTLLITYMLWTMPESTRLNPRDYIANHASGGNPLILRRYLDLQSVIEKLSEQDQRGPATVS